MPKLKLDLQKLSVESFETSMSKTEKGTIIANATWKTCDSRYEFHCALTEFQCAISEYCHSINTYMCTLDCQIDLNTRDC